MPTSRELQQPLGLKTAICARPPVSRSGTSCTCSGELLFLGPSSQLLMVLAYWQSLEGHWLRFPDETTITWTILVKLWLYNVHTGTSAACMAGRLWPLAHHWCSSVWNEGKRSFLALVLLSPSPSKAQLLGDTEGYQASCKLQCTFNRNTHVQ